MTLHAWSGIGIGVGTVEQIVSMLHEAAFTRLQRTTDLIIDHVNRCSARLMDVVDGVCRHVRASNDPFGGIRVVLVGDPLQVLMPFLFLLCNPQCPTLCYFRLFHLFA